MLDVVTSSSISPEIRKPHRVRRQFLRDGRRGAVIRALTAASIERTAYPLLPGVEAHEATGSNRRYLWAATILLKAEDPTLIQAVLEGRVGLIAAAKQLQRAANVVAAIRKASPEDLEFAGRTLGAELVFNRMVSPAL